MLSALYIFLHALLLAILFSKDWISCLSRRDSDRLPKVMRVYNSGQSRKGAALAQALPGTAQGSPTESPCGSMTV